jgi:hypothetical protein
MTGIRRADPEPLEALRRWLARQPSVTVTVASTGDGGRWDVRSGGETVAVGAGGAGELQVMLPADIARRVADGRSGVRLAPGGVVLDVADAASAAFARSLLARLIGVELFAWQYRADGV